MSFDIADLKGEEHIEGDVMHVNPLSMKKENSISRPELSVQRADSDDSIEPIVARPVRPKRRSVFGPDKVIVTSKKKDFKYHKPFRSAVRFDGPTYALIGVFDPLSQGTNATIADGSSDERPVVKHIDRVTGITSFEMNEVMYVVSCSVDRTVRVWALPTNGVFFSADGQPSIECDVTVIGKRKFGDVFTSVAVHLFADKGLVIRPIIATTGRDNRLRLFDFSNPEQNHYCPVVDYMTGNAIEHMVHGDWITGVILYAPKVYENSHHNGDLGAPLVAITCGMDKTVRVWTLAVGDIIKKNTNTRRASIFGQQSGQTKSEGVFGSISVGGSVLTQAKYNPKINDEDNQEEASDDWTLCIVGKHHSSGVSSVTYHDREDPLIISGDSVGDILLWSTNAVEIRAREDEVDFRKKSKEYRQLVPLRKLEGHKKSISCLTVINSFHGMNSMLVSTSDDCLVKIWNLETGDAIRSLEGHEKNAGAVVVLPLKDAVVTTLGLNEEKKKDDELELKKPHLLRSFEPVLISADLNGLNLFIWNFQSFEEVKSTTLSTTCNGHMKAITCMTFFQVYDSNIFLFGSGKLFHDLYLISGSKDTTVRISFYNVILGHVDFFLEDKDTRATQSVASAHTEEVTALLVHNHSDFNTYCVTASSDKFLKVWKLEERSGELVYKIALNSGITCLAILCPDAKDGEKIEPFIVAGCTDRAICTFSFLQMLECSPDCGLRPQRCHEDSVFQVVALNGSRKLKKDPLIVSSSIRGEIIVWHWPMKLNVLHRTTFNYPGNDGRMFLNVCTPTSGLPFVACAGDNSNYLRTWDPWSETTPEPDILDHWKTDDKKLAKLSHTMTRSVRFKSSITSMNSYAPENSQGLEVIILIGHDDGSVTKYDSITKWKDSLYDDDDDNETCENDGDSSNDVVSVAVGHYRDGLMTAVGIGSLIKIYNAKGFWKTVEGREPFVNALLVGRNMFGGPCRLIAACNDKCVRLIELSNFTEYMWHYGWIDISYRNIQMCIYKRDTKFVDYFFDSKDPKDLGHILAGGTDEPFGLYKLYELRYTQVCSGGTTENFIPLSGLKFYEYCAVKNSSTNAYYMNKDSSWLPFIIAANKDGIIEVWKWISQPSDTIVCVHRFNVIDFYEYMGIEKPKVLEEIKGESVSSGSVKKLQEIKNNPIFCLDTCPRFNFIAVGSLLGYPLILDSTVTCSAENELKPENYELKLSMKDRQFRVEKLEGSCHGDAITAIRIFTRKLENERQSINIVTGSKDKKIILWDYIKRKKIWGPIEASTDGAVKSITVFDPVAEYFSSVGNPVIVVAGGDTLVRVFSYKGELMRQLDMHTKLVVSAEILWTWTLGPVLISSSVDNTIKYTDAYFILTNTFPTHASVRNAFNKDRKDILASKKSGMKWQRMRDMCKLAGGGHKLFSENSRLFLTSMIDRDEYSFMETFLSSCPEVIFIPQAFDQTSLMSEAFAKTYSEVTGLSEFERKKLLDRVSSDLQSNNSVNTSLWVDKNGYISLLTVAILIFNRDDVEDIISAMLKLFNSPLQDLYAQFYPVGLRVPKSDFLNLAEKMPAEFLRLIIGTKFIKAQLVVRDKLKRRLERGQFEVKGVTFGSDLDGLWKPKVAKKSVWRKKINGSEKDQAVTPMTIMIPELASFEMLNAYIHVCKELDDVTLFDSDVGRCALSFSWRSFGKTNHITEFMKHLAYSLLFSLSLFLFARLTDGVDFQSSILLQSRSGFAWFLQGLSILGVFYYSHGEYLQLHGEYDGNFTEYIKDMWNINDILLHSTLFAGTVLRIAYLGECTASRNTLSVCAIFMYFKILYYLRAFKLTGPLVAMIFQIVHDIIPFCLVLFIVLFGFSHSFWIISLQDLSLPFGTFQNALLNSFDYMLGNFSSDYSGTTSPQLGAFLYVCYMLIVALLLLNLLIALMGDSFSNVRSRGIAQWRMEATSIIHDQVHLMPIMKDPIKERHLTRFYPRMLHLLVRTSDLERESTTEEQVADLAAKLTSLEAKLEGKLDRVTKAMVDANLIELDDDDDELSVDEDQEDNGEGDEDEEGFGYDDEDYRYGDDLNEEEQRYESFEVSTHKHPLFFCSQSNGWRCDGSDLDEGCVKGCTGFNQTRGWNRYNCAECDFDYCQGCALKYATNAPVPYGSNNIDGESDIEETKEDLSSSEMGSPDLPSENRVESDAEDTHSTRENM